MACLTQFSFLPEDLKASIVAKLSCISVPLLPKPPPARPIRRRRKARLQRVAGCATPCRWAEILARVSRRDGRAVTGIVHRILKAYTKASWGSFPENVEQTIVSGCSYLLTGGLGAGMAKFVDDLHSEQKTGASRGDRCSACDEAAAAGVLLPAISFVGAMGPHLFYCRKRSERE